jgi:MFS family permease
MRWLNRVLAAIFGLALAIAGGAVVWGAVAAVLEPSSRRIPHEGWIASQDGYRWNSPEVLWMGAGLAAVGLLLVALQLLPRRPSALGAALGENGVRVEVDRTGLERALTREAAGVEGVTGARTRSRRRKVRTKVDVPRGGDRATTEAVEGVLRSGLERFRVKPSPRVAVSSRVRGRAR